MKTGQSHETQSASRSAAEVQSRIGNAESGLIVESPVQKMIDHTPRIVAQRKLIQCIFGKAAQLREVEDVPLQGRFAASDTCPVLQAKTNVITNLGDGADDKTSNKLIETPTQGQKWFRFAKDGNVINSFANNITTKMPAGASPVNRTIDLADSPGVTQSDIPSMTRPQHFRMGDSLAGIRDSDRTDTWTWHHKVDKYKMELVDMYTHGGFYHYGGFSQWDMDEGDAAD